MPWTEQLGHPLPNIFGKTFVGATFKYHHVASFGRGSPSDRQGEKGHPEDVLRLPRPILPLAARQCKNRGRRMPGQGSLRRAVGFWWEVPCKDGHSGSCLGRSLRYEIMPSVRSVADVAPRLTDAPPRLRA